MKTERVHQFTVGDRLRKAREKAGYDQREFEAVSGISRATISAYELGKSTPRRAYLSIWASMTDTDLEWLLTGETTRPADGPDADSAESSTIPPDGEAAAPPRKAATGGGSEGGATPT